LPGFIILVEEETVMYFCGIDVAKRKHVVLVLDEQGQVVKPPVTIHNTRAGFEQLHRVLSSLAGSVSIGMEATGHYWLTLFENLSDRYPVTVLNPMQIHAYRRSGVRKCKTDQADAFWIADFVRIGNRPPTNQSTPLLLQLRELTRFRSRLSEQIGDCKRKILSVLDRVFPEYETVFSDVFLRSSRQLLIEAVSAQDFADFDLCELTQRLQSASRGHFGQEKAESIQQLACQSVGINFLADAVRVEMRCLIEQIELLETQRCLLDEKLADLMDQIPQHITTIPGVGHVTGAAILAEIGDVQRFEAPEKLVAYAGVDAAVYQTGQFEAKEMHMSKRGSPYLRHALWQAAFAASRHDPELRAYYQRKRAEGKDHGVALGAICRKLLHRIYVILKEQRPYIVR
jgi:transposase